MSEPWLIPDEARGVEARRADLLKGLQQAKRLRANNTGSVTAWQEFYLAVVCFCCSMVQGRFSAG